MTSHEHAKDPGHAEPSVEELREMTDLERSRMGARMDEIEIVHREDSFEPGSRADKRAERIVTACFGLTFLASVAFVVIYVAWPWEFEVGDQGFLSYWTYTPLLGITMGLALVGLAAGLVLWGKLLMPHEEAVEARHDGFSDPVDREVAAGTLHDSAAMTGLGRRTALRRTLGLAGGALGLLALAPLGGFIKKPGDAMYATPWAGGMRLYDSNGVPMRPQDMQPGSLATVFPRSEEGEVIVSSDSPAMLIRVRPEQRVHHRRGQEGYGWEDYVAYSKICTHAGCPVSLYEQQTARLLCPCHQSQFDVTQDAKPIFGPATRSLPSLPIEVDDEGYFRTRSGFTEAVGPAFWERG